MAKVSKRASSKVKKTKKVTKKPAKKVAPKKPAKASRPAPKVRSAKLTKKAAVPKIVKAPRVAKAKTPKAKSSSASSGPKGYTPAQYEKFKEEKNRLFNMSNQALKDILKKNMTSMTGNKDDLVFKVADGIVLGRIPRCHKCFGGRPKFDYMKGTYYCSGYRDDEDFHNCQTLFQLDEIKRLPWE